MLNTGTDHPFFPPLDEKESKWMSVESNSLAIRKGMGEVAEANAILGNNAKEILRL
jgi:aminocarboxymuconate-semialdehyde decarboxylase